MHQTFMNKENRDRAWQAGGRRGRRGSMRNQCMHPMYIEDYTQVTAITLSRADCGFGNTIYKTHFPVVYTLDTDY